MRPRVWIATQCWSALLAVLGTAACGSDSATGASSDDHLTETIGADRGFATNGHLVIEGDTEADRILALRDGSILIAVSEPAGCRLVRVSSAGVVDSSFAGKLPAIGGVGYVTDLVELPDGRILVLGAQGGRRTLAPFGLLYLARLGRDGTLDTTFGSGGQVMGGAALSFPAVPTVAGVVGDVPLHIAVQPDGKILVVGQVPSSAVAEQAFIGRFNADGVVDASFGTSGSVSTLVAPGNVSVVRGVVIQSDGKIVLSVPARSNGLIKNVLLRLNSDGKQDTSFGAGGFAEIVAPINDGLPGRPDVIQIGADLHPASNDEDKILAIALVQQLTSFEVGSWRFDRNGHTDASYGAAGVVLAPTGRFDGQLLAATATSNDGVISMYPGTFVLDPRDDKSRCEVRENDANVRAGSVGPFPQGFTVTKLQTPLQGICSRGISISFADGRRLFVTSYTFDNGAGRTVRRGIVVSQYNPTLKVAA